MMTSADLGGLTFKLPFTFAALLPRHRCPGGGRGVEISPAVLRTSATLTILLQSSVLSHLVPDTRCSYLWSSGYSAAAEATKGT